ncbi:hypothetical protein VE03_06356 [Pseudogymnoascus sp. 23342-1-I1]|nr:hypothetical protein VE03_06356 [Pseudogymnoascus sp. 23342-1-I1]
MPTPLRPYGADGEGIGIWLARRLMPYSTPVACRVCMHAATPAARGPPRGAVQRFGEGADTLAAMTSQGWAGPWGVRALSQGHGMYPAHTFWRYNRWGLVQTRGLGIWNSGDGKNTRGEAEWY